MPVISVTAEKVVQCVYQDCQVGFSCVAGADKHPQRAQVNLCLGDGDEVGNGEL